MPVKEVLKACNTDKQSRKKRNEFWKFKSNPNIYFKRWIEYSSNTLIIMKNSLKSF